MRLLGLVEHCLPTKISDQLEEEETDDGYQVSSSVCPSACLSLCLSVPLPVCLFYFEMWFCAESVQQSLERMFGKAGGNVPITPSEAFEKRMGVRGFGFSPYTLAHSLTDTCTHTCLFVRTSIYFPRDDILSLCIL